MTPSSGRRHKAHPVSGLTCPHCGRPVHAVGQVADGRPVKPPEEGDIRVCIDCGEPAFYVRAADGSLALDSPTAGELAYIHSMPQMQAIRAAMRGRADRPC